MPKFLNVGGGTKTIPIPEFFADWQHDLLDIDPKDDVDIVCDARQLSELRADTYDAVYCSHNLEHYYAHDVVRVIAGFKHVLKPSGFVYARVPDVQYLMRYVVEHDMDIEDTLYHVGKVPIKVHDVMYGWGKKMEVSGNDFYAHKMGFSTKSLNQAFDTGGFPYRVQRQWKNVWEIRIAAFLGQPSSKQLKRMGFPGVSWPNVEG